MKKNKIYLSLILLVVLSIGIDLAKRGLRLYSAQLFNLLPTLLFEIVANILFALLLIWITIQISKRPLPRSWSIVLMVIGLLMIIMPILCYTGILAIAPLQFTIAYWSYSGIAGAYLLLVGGMKLLFKE